MEPTPATRRRANAIPLHGPPASAITGWGYAVPDRVLTNADLASVVDTTDEWIASRTGIRERRIAGAGETTGTLATEAARRALVQAGIASADVDLIIVCTLTPDYGGMPSAASVVQHAIGAHVAGAIDLNAACSGFMYGLGIAHGLVASGVHRTVLLIGAETLSRVVDWHDRTTCILFGDGAGAIVLSATTGDGPAGSTHAPGHTLLSHLTGSDGRRGETLYIPAGGGRTPASYETVDARAHFIRMEGREVYRFAVTTIPDACLDAIAAASLTVDQIDLFVMHQANLRILHAVAEAIGAPWDRVFVNIDRYGNTSAASIPIAICEAVTAGRLQPGDRVLLAGFGGGLTWSAAVVEWRA